MPDRRERHSKIAELTYREKALVRLKIKEISLHERVTIMQNACNVPPLLPPMARRLLKSAKQEAILLIGLAPPLVVKSRRNWQCVGNLRALSIARAILMDDEEISCIQVTAAGEDLERRVLLELVMQPALLGARREDIQILAEIAARAEGMGHILSKGRHGDAISYVASLYGLERRQLKKRRREKGEVTKPMASGDQGG